MASSYAHAYSSMGLLDASLPPAALALSTDTRHVPTPVSTTTVKAETSPTSSSSAERRKATTPSARVKTEGERREKEPDDVAVPPCKKHKKADLSPKSSTERTTDHRTEHRSDHRTEHRSDHRTEHRSDHRVDHRTEHRSIHHDKFEKFDKYENREKKRSSNSASTSSACNDNRVESTIKSPPPPPRPSRPTQEQSRRYTDQPDEALCLSTKSSRDASPVKIMKSPDSTTSSNHRRDSTTYKFDTQEPSPAKDRASAFPVYPYSRAVTSGKL